MYRPTHQRGFTLIELVVIIVILGVLAVTALPRFVDLDSEAKTAAIEGLYASINDAAALAYSKAVIEGVEQLPRTTAPGDGNSNGTPPVETNLGYLELKYGYPEANAEYGLGILDLAHLGGGSNWKEDADWDICAGSELAECGSIDKSPSSNIRIGFGIDDDPDLKCYVRYVEPTGTDNPFDEDSFYLEKQTEEC